MDLSTPQVMGILNATPDSFYSGSRKQTGEEIARRAIQIVEEGGTIVDVGAFSTRPGADIVSEEEELARLRHALTIVRRELPDTPVSVDTYRPHVARVCVEELGADIINDVSEGGITGVVDTPIDEPGDMFETVARLGVPYILMSVKSNLHDMMIAFAAEVDRLHSLGVKDIILDPGFGFGKSLDDNYRIMAGLNKLSELDLPLLVGISRKSMIFRLLDGTPETSLNGTTVLNTMAIAAGASILRVHDVAECVEAVRIMGRMQINKDQNIIKNV